jgi:hypothetical protein
MSPGFFHRKIIVVLMSIVVVLMSIVFALALIEIALRLFSPQPIPVASLPIVYVPDEMLEYRLKPLVKTGLGFDTNRFGLRDYDHYKLKKPKNTYRILFLGDSYIFSVTELEKSIPKILEKLLEGRRPKIEVLNAGVFGYGTINEYLYLKNYGLKFSPDLVLLGIYVQNDCADNAGFPDRTAVGGRQILLSSTRKESKEIIFLKVKAMEFLYSFHIYRFLKNRNLHTSIFDGKTNYRFRKNNEKEDCIVAWGRYPFNQNPLNVGERCKKTIDYLNKIFKITNDNDIKLGMVLIPDAVQFDNPAANRVKRNRENRYKKANYDWDNPQNELMALAKKYGWRMLNPLPEMRKKTRGKYIYYCDDPHFNEEGNEYCAKEIAGWLTKSKLIP